MPPVEHARSPLSGQSRPAIFRFLAVPWPEPRHLSLECFSAISETLSASAAKSARFFRECRSCGLFWIGIQITEHHFFCSTHISFPNYPIFALYSQPEHSRLPVMRWRITVPPWTCQRAAGNQCCAIAAFVGAKVMMKFAPKLVLLRFFQRCQG